MKRNDAFEKLMQLKGQDLVPLAKKYCVDIWRDDQKRKNKGWAGHVLERYLGLPINSAQSPNFGSWELKSISLKRLKNGRITVKETMAITTIDQYNISQTPFEESHLLAKLRKAIVCARMFESQEENSSVLMYVSKFDLNCCDYAQVKKDYEEVRSCIENRGFEFLTGGMGSLVQPRTKGTGHGSTTRAFYARTPFVARMLGISEHD